MKGGYIIEQFPKNKVIDHARLSTDQIAVRSKSKTRNYGDTITCKNCCIEQPLAEFYIKDRHSGRRSTKCRDCVMKEIGVIEIGKKRFAEKIFKKHFRRCGVCKTIKPLTEFSKNKHDSYGYNGKCQVCSYALLRKWQERRRKIKSPKYFLEGLAFKNGRELAKYLFKKYAIPETTTTSRLTKGYSAKDCAIPEFELRSRAHTKGKVQVKDLINGKIYTFKSTRDSNLLKMFSGAIITRSIKTGKPTPVNCNSKFKHPCLLTRLT